MWRIGTGIGLILVALLLFAAAVAQEEALPPVKVGGGGGPASGWLFLDLSSLNQVLEAHHYGPLGNGILLMGGGGFGGQLSGWRFGGFGRGWGITSAKEAKKVELAVGYGGFVMEYSRPLAQGISLSFGGLFGGGGAELTLLDHQSDSFDAAISDPPNTNLERVFFALEPYGVVELELLEFMWLRLGVGYLWTPWLSEWMQDERSLPGPPEDFSAPIVFAQFAFVGFEAEEVE